jgi:hypothetical protein
MSRHHHADPIRGRCWPHALRHAVSRALSTYQSWNALYLNPQTYGQARHCYATAHQAFRRAHRVQRWQACTEQRMLDTLAATLAHLSTAELEGVIARWDTARAATALTTMSDATLAGVMADLDADARRAHRR